ncbi:CoA-transferase, partial [Pacificibacter sp.]|uniref:CoA-transferase n=1 Tax=Pacificibacter sp. TaxID=1917866 RepID=UPI00321AE72D
LIKGQEGDTVGNLTYRLAGRNFNPLMAMAADKTIAQVSVLGAAGTINPEQVITPGIFVDAVVEVSNPQHEEVLVRTGEVH